MLVKFLGLLGIKFLAKKIAQIVLKRVVYQEIRALVKKSDNKVDDEIAEEVILAIESAVRNF